MNARRIINTVAVIGSVMFAHTVLTLPAPAMNPSHATVQQAAPAGRSTPTARPAGTAPVLKKGSRGRWVRTLQARLNDLDDAVCWWWKPCLNEYRIMVDGEFGEQTLEAVQMFQAQQDLRRDGIVGPRTWERLYAPKAACDVARLALQAAGATVIETNLGVTIARRESGCHLAQFVDRPSTADYSAGPFGMNYFGPLLVPRTAWLGAPRTNTYSWQGAVENMLELARKSGWCHWNSPNYCKG